MNATLFYRAVYFDDNIWQLQIGLGEEFSSIFPYLETAGGEIRQFKDIETIYKTVRNLQQNNIKDNNGARPFIDIITHDRLLRDAESESI